MVSWFKAGAALILGFLVVGCPAWAQNLAPPFGIGGTNGIAPLPNLRPSNPSEVLRHRDFAGKPCLAIGAFARPHTVDLNLYDHVISVHNNCPQRIALQVCYYETRDCISMEIPGGEHKEAILGTLPSAKDFRYEFREKF